MANAQPPTASVVPQYESSVELELTRCKRRLRSLDLGAAGLLLACTILGYGLGLSLADRLWELPHGVRLAAWACLVIAIAVGLGFALTRFVLRPVNPRYVALQLEHTVPGAKNSVINWLDLRREALAPVIRGSLGRRAAKDLGRANAERAITATPLWWLGGAAGILLLIQVGWLLAAPGQALSLLQRAFFPFDKASIAARTALTLVQPATGNITIGANQPVNFRIEAEGYVPAVNQKDSLKLHYRYHDTEPFEERSLVQDVDGTWTTVVLADQVRNGFWYKITGGDAQIPQDQEYRVDVRPSPQVLRYQATFKYRDYLHYPDRSVDYDKSVRPSIKELRGTEVTLTIKTNRILQRCALELTTNGVKKELPGQLLPGDPESCRFKWVLDHSGEFRVLFESKDGEANVDREPCPIVVIPDLAPIVEMTKPAKDLSLPANGTLLVEGQATDDFGVKSMQLRLKLLKAPTIVELKPKLYRPDKQFKLVNGKYPLRLDYTDFVALESVQSMDGAAYRLAEGMELEYWIEARDNCDYPNKDGNLGQSVHYKLTIDPPESNKNKSSQDRQDAQKQTQKSQQKQDSNIADQNTIAQAQNDAKDGKGGGQKSGSDNKDRENKAQQVKELLDKQESKGDAKGAGQGLAGEKKDNPQDGSAGAPPPKDNPAGKKDDPGQNKEQDKQGQSGQEKPGQSGQDPSKASAKDEGKKRPDQQHPGTQKGADPKPGAGADSPKADPKSPPKPGADPAKGSPSAEAKPDASKDKGPGSAGKESEKPGSPAADQGQKTRATDKSAAKDAPIAKEPAADVKGNDTSNQPPPADAKLGPPDSSQNAGQAKTGDRKDATMDDVNDLQQQLKDTKRREEAQKALEKIGEQAGDPKVGKAAEKALEDATAKRDTTKDAGQPKDGTGQEKTPSSAKTGPQKQGNGNPGMGKQGSINPDDHAGPSPVDEESARRAGELQLESLKKEIDKLRSKLTPKVLKDLNWTEKDREDFLRDALADALRRQQQKGPGESLPARGSLRNLLPNSGPRNLQRPGNNNDGSVVDDRLEPPPELREAQRIFQLPAVKDKK